MSEIQNKVNVIQSSHVNDNGIGLIIGSIFSIFIYGIFGAGINDSTNIVVKITYIAIGVSLVFMLIAGVYLIAFSKSEDKNEDFTDMESSYIELNKNYQILRKQTQLGFLFSLFAMLVGLGIILFFAGRYFVYNIDIDKMSVLAGVIVEFISATFIVVYRLNFNKLNSISDELFKMWKVMLAFKKVNDYEGDNKSEVFAKLIESLVRD